VRPANLDAIARDHRGTAVTVRRVGALDVASSARQVTRLLEDLGVPRGRGVAVLGANTPEFLAVFRGAVWSGRYFTAMSWRWTAEDVAYVAGNCEAGALFADARWPHLAAAAAPSFPEHARFSIGGPLPGFRPWSDVEASRPEPRQAPRAGETML
jgi:fatty-acyl-CoA synthase